MTNTNDPTGPLAGFRVLDLTTVLFGPYASQTLGDWGADVIKIERLSGDTWRTAGPFRNRGMSGQFMAVNRNKRSIAIDLKHPDGKTVLQRLLRTTDVLDQQYPAGGTRTAWFFLRRLQSAKPSTDLCIGHRVWSGRTVAGASRIRRNHSGGLRFCVRAGDRVGTGVRAKFGCG